MAQERVLIMGAAGRDFHVFNTVFRDDPEATVVAFTAAQIPGIAGRRYPPELAGPRYREGIPIEPEDALEQLIRDLAVDRVVFAYSDVSHEHVMHAASRALAAGADFSLYGPRRTMLRSRRPVVAVGAVRTGSGKSQTTRYLARRLEAAGLRTVVVRHPMPYGDLVAQRVQRFAEAADLDRHRVTIEEREEYEPHLEAGRVVYAGVDYAEIVRAAEAEAEVLLWDGGNNDFPFLAPNLFVVVADPLRPGHELRYHPGETNLRLADVVVINKVDSAEPAAVRRVRASVEAANPRAAIVEARSAIAVDRPIAGLRVAVVEDGPTLTHGEMTYGAGVVAARRFGAAEIVDPRPYAVGSIAETLAAHPRLERLIPAMGYGEAQVADLRRTLEAMPVDVVLSASPIDLGRLLRLDRPVVRVRYELEELAGPSLASFLEPIVAVVRAARAGEEGGRADASAAPA
jgi:predicted GTPase